MGQSGVGFNRRGDSFGGLTIAHTTTQSFLQCFNRRGDSFGGLTMDSDIELQEKIVSIAGAILLGG